MDVGACEHPRPSGGPGEVTGQHWTSKTTLAWSPVTGASSYFAYRGSLESLGYGSVGTCAGPALTDTVVTDVTTPAAGTGFASSI